MGSVGEVPAETLDDRVEVDEDGLTPERRRLHDEHDKRHAENLVPIPQELNDEYWRAGVLYHLLDKLQQQIYDKWYSLSPRQKIAVSLIARRVGKTFTYACIAIELALNNPGSLQLYCSLSSKQVREMLLPTFDKILQHCPPELQPKLILRDNRFVFPNGSQIVLAGVEDKTKANRLRGNGAIAVWIDEAGYLPILGYVVRSIALPFLKDAPNGNGKLTMYSNAPESPSHEIKGFVERAKNEGTFFHATVFDSPRYTPQEIKEFADATGGMDTSEWKIEYLAEFTIDENSAVIPEWSDREDKYWVQVEDSFRARLPEAEDPEHAIRPPLVRVVERPQYYDIYTSIDLGWAPDLTSILAMYWDFDNARLVVENERELQRMTTDALAKAVRELEQETWGPYWDSCSRNHGWEPKPYLRVMDVDKQIQHDLGALHGLSFMQANNQDLHSQINRLRQLVKSGKIVVNPRCKKLIAHLRAAYWDSNRRRFARPSRKPRPDEPIYYGHFDHLSALQLGFAHISKHHDPHPDMPAGVSHRTHLIGKHAPRSRSANKGLVDFFTSRSPFSRSR